MPHPVRRSPRSPPRNPDGTPRVSESRRAVPSRSQFSEKEGNGGGHDFAERPSDGKCPQARARPQRWDALRTAQHGIRGRRDINQRGSTGQKKRRTTRANRCHGVNVKSRRSRRTKQRHHHFTFYTHTRPGVKTGLNLHTQGRNSSALKTFLGLKYGQIWAGIRHFLHYPQEIRGQSRRRPLDRADC